MNHTGVDDHAIESICNGLFQCYHELYAEDELDKAGFTDHLPYMMFGLMKPDNAKETKIVSISAVETRIS